MTKEEAVRRVERLIERPDLLHTPPEVAQSLLQLTQDEDCAFYEIVDCIKTDLAMSSRVLKLVNSPRFGLNSPVTNLHQAVTMLGQRSIRLIAMTFSITQAFAGGPARELYNEFWRRALATAAAAYQLGKRVDHVDQHDAYTAGLLAQIGTLLLAQAEGELYLSFYRRNVGQNLAGAERDSYGVDHADVGGHLLQKWNFPESTANAVLNHLNDEVEDPLALVVKGGTLISEVVWGAERGSVQSCRHLLESYFRVDIDEFAGLALRVREEVLLELDVYGVDSDDPPEPAKLLEIARQRYFEESMNSALDMDSFQSIYEGKL